MYYMYIHVAIESREVKNVIIVLKSQYASDINECAQDENKCYYHSHCVNTEGSYKCVCDSGYAPWGRLCVGESLDMIIIMTRYRMAENGCV